MSLTRLTFLLLAACFSATTSIGQVGNKWVKTFTPGSGTSAVDITTDAAGNVYVVAEKTAALNSSVTIKYDSLGNQLWSHTYTWPGHSTSPRKLLVDGAGNVYVGAHIADNFNYKNYLLYKLDPSGTTMLWSDTMTYAGFSHINSLNDMAFDPQGNIVVAGTMWGINTLWFVAKVNPSGTELWRTPNSLTHFGFLRGMALDASGNIYAAGGMVPSSPPGDRWVVRKFSPTGGLTWSDIWDADSTVDVYETAFDIGLDAAGNAYAVGTVGVSNHFDFFVRKYNPAGAAQWSQTISGAPNANIDEGGAIYVTPGGNAYVTGHSRVSQAANRDMMTAKVSTAGVVEWTKVYDNGNIDIPHGIHGTSFPEAVVITGMSWSSTGQDIMTIKYKADGTTAWEKRYNTVYYAAGNAVHVDTDNDVYVGGYENGMSIALRIQDADAHKRLTVTNAGGTYNFWDTDPSHNTGLTIEFGPGASGPIDVSLLKNPAANLDWCASSGPVQHQSKYRWNIDAQFTGQSTYAYVSFAWVLMEIALGIYQGGMDDPSKFTVLKRPEDGYGQFCPVPTTYANGQLKAEVTGFSEFIIGSNTDSFNYTPLSVAPIQIVDEVSLYPNPSKLSSQVVLNPSASSFVNISVYDVSGKLVASPYNGMMRAGQQSVAINTANLSKGMYFCKVQVGRKEAILKLAVSN